MFLTNRASNLIQQIDTSFEVSYASLCNQPVSLQSLLALRLEKDKGWVRFYPNSNAYAPDLDDTSLFYLALVKKDQRFSIDARKIIDECSNLRTSSGLAATWPHRELSNTEQGEAVVNLHFLWLNHLLGLRDKNIEAYVCEWMIKKDITTTYYHNELFILLSAMKACDDFVDSNFKTYFKTELKKQIHTKCYTLARSYSELQYPQGLFKHAGKEVFFHFPQPPPLVTGGEMAGVSRAELKKYYAKKVEMYGKINN